MFRVVQIGKALQDQQWLFESLMAQVEERRSAVESNAKQIEDRWLSTSPAERRVTVVTGSTPSDATHEPPPHPYPLPSPPLFPFADSVG